MDGQGGVRDPRGMFGRSLGLELLVVTISETAFQTLVYCVERAHLSFEGVVAAPYASALAALEDDEMDLGCVCIDMGGGSTSVAVFQQGSLVHIDSLPVGGAHVTADIARGLSTSTQGAERIKTLHGSAIASANEDREMIEAPPRGDDPGAVTFRNAAQAALKQLGKGVVPYLLPCLDMPGTKAWTGLVLREITGAQLCAKCNTAAVVMMDGCMTCLSCGDSKCG